jgi:anti-sigma factor RsiW
VTARSCDEIVGKLVDYADGELPDAELAEVAEHVAHCEPCRERLDALRRSLELAQAVWNASEAALASLRPGIASDRERGRAIWTGWRRVALVAAAAALFIAVGLLRYVAREPSPPPASSLRKAVPEELRLQVARVAIAAQLLMAADLLAEQPGGEDLACERYRYVLSAYPETEAAARAGARLAWLCDERIEP